MELIKKIIRKIRNLLLKIPDRILPKFFYKSRFTAILYYILFSNSFNREFQSVLAGKAKHLKETNVDKENYYLLVRNIHRLEKGLLMRPRKDVFATGYIGETIDSYLSVMKNSEKYRPDQLGWFTDVLYEYFKVAGEDKEIDFERNRFLSCEQSKDKRSLKKIPYLRDLKEKCTISFDEFYHLSRQRRSVRWFENKPVPRELIDRALLAAVQAPSACNRQPFEFRIFDNPNKVQEIVNIPMGTRGYANNIKTIVVVIGNLDAYFSERDRHIIYIDASLASMSFMYALETLGLSSCPINWPDIEDKEKKMDNILDLKLHERPIMLIAVGFPDKDGKVAFSEKRPLEMIRNYNK